MIMIILTLIVSLFMSALFGLAPMILGIVKDKKTLGFSGLGATVAAGFFGLSLPVAIVFVVLILVLPNKTDDQTVDNNVVDV